MNLERVSVSEESKNLMDPQTQGDRLGYILYDPATQTVLEKYNEEKAFIPASTTKILSSVAALHILGSKYSFPTYLGYTGKIEGHVLKGDLYLKGTGDPFLKASNLMHMSKVLASKGVRRITGKFNYDESTLVPTNTIEDTREPWASYNTGVSALSSEFNTLRVEWAPKKIGSAHQLVSIPDYSFLKFDLSEKDFGSETDLTFQQEGAQEVWSLSPLRWQGHQRLPIKNPALATATLFSELCKLNGIELPAPVPGQYSKNTKLLSIHHSRPLLEIVELLLEYSNNLVAELVQMSAARKLAGHPVSKEEAAHLIQRWLEKKIPLLNRDLHLENGSGLTSKNRISPSHFVHVLNFADKTLAPSYETLLPISGVKGSLANRMTSPDTAFRIWAKTGSMNYTKSLSGFLYSKSGKRLTFAVMQTHWKNRKVLDQSFEPISGEELDRAGDWNSKSVQTEDLLLTQWIRGY